MYKRGQNKKEKMNRKTKKVIAVLQAGGIG